MEAYAVEVVTFQLIVCAALLLCGAALVFVGWRGLRGRLPRNRKVGIRTPATMRSEEAFELGNRAAAPATLASGGVALLSGVSVPLLPSLFSAGLVTVMGVLGGFVLMAVGGVIGNRAAEAMPEPTGGCAGCAGGCCSALQRS
jgi:hypothetical protein